MDVLWILAATVGISLLAFVGALAMVLSEEKIKRVLLLLVGFSAGALIGGAFLHLLPEAIEESAEPSSVFIATILGFMIFFLLEKLMWRHCHDTECPIHTFAYLNLIGDGVHNFIDGLIIAASFITDVRLGLATTLAVAAHEIPQELGDFGVIVYGGIKPKRALIFNFMTALTCVGGGLIGFVLKDVQFVGELLVPVAAGGFLYIAASDLIPELHKEKDRIKTWLSFLSFVIGILFMWIIKLIFEH